MSKGLGATQRKILLLLLGGLALGLSGSPRRYFYILEQMEKEWKDINKWALRQAIRKLYQSKLITEKTNKDGSTTLVLSDSGKKYAMTYKLDEMKIKEPKTWDGQWRVIAFDIPEQRKKARDELRFRFRQIGLQELQKSIFVYPYPCEKEVDFLVEFYQLRPYVRKIIAHSIDNELHLKQKFGLMRS